MISDDCKRFPQELLLRMLMKSRVLERRKLRKATNISQRVSWTERMEAWQVLAIDAIPSGYLT